VLERACSPLPARITTVRNMLLSIVLDVLLSQKSLDIYYKVRASMQAVC
jgi:hypothetical protein